MERAQELLSNERRIVRIVAIDGAAAVEHNVGVACGIVTGLTLCNPGEYCLVNLIYVPRYLLKFDNKGYLRFMLDKFM